MISIRLVKNEYRVYDKRKLVGTCRKFCCGIDFRPNYTKSMFSILAVRDMNNPKLKKCIEAIRSINIPSNGHFNFHPDRLKDLAKYEKNINS